MPRRVNEAKSTSAAGAAKKDHLKYQIDTSLGQEFI
jgi:hypothetical protein